MAVRIPFRDDYYAVSTFTFVISPRAKGAGHKFWRGRERERVKMKNWAASAAATADGVKK